jgi:diacylglycerol O-acyltransferase / wax synthase
VPLPQLRVLARRHGARVTDVLLSAVAGALSRVRPDLRPGRLRTLVPLLARDESAPAEGNLTAAAMVDLPLHAASEVARLAEVVRRSRRLRTGTRAAASRFVVQAAGSLPPPLPRWFARTVYRGRFFHAIVSNMPGPATPLSLAGKPLLGAYPIVPLADGSPLAVGALGWHGVLHLGILADPALIEDADEFGAAIRAVIDAL